MKRVALYYFENIDKLNLNFRFKNIIVSTEYENFLLNGNKELLAISEVDLQNKIEIALIISVDRYFESHMDFAVEARPHLLNALNFICFFTRKAIVVNSVKLSSILPTALNSDTINVGTCYREGVDITASVNVFFERISLMTKGMTYECFSALDQYRKAIYFELESIDSELLSDEIIIIFTRIIENLTNNNYKKYQEDLRLKILSFFNSVDDEIFIHDNRRRMEFERNFKKKVRSLIDEEVSLSYKVKYFFKYYGIEHISMNEFLEDIILYRNSSAHGRISYTTDFSLPFNSFFPIFDARYFYLDFIKIIVGRMLDVFIGTTFFEAEYEDVKVHIPPHTQGIVEYLESNTFTQGKFYENDIAENSLYFISFKIISRKIKPKIAANLVSSLLSKYLEMEKVNENFIFLMVATYEFLKKNDQVVIARYLDQYFYEKKVILWYDNGYELYRDLKSRKISFKYLDDKYK